LLASGLLLLLIRSRPRHPIELLPPPTVGPIQVHVAGAVGEPGVVSLASGSIVEQAIAAAGGPTGDADLSRLNLAERLQAGQQVYVPLSLPTDAPAGDDGPTSDANPMGRININTATESQLEQLPGIGPSLASKLVEYRLQHGLFQEAEELLLVSGIGPAKLDQIRDLITFH
jgi:competence protein ComEA